MIQRQVLQGQVHSCACAYYSRIYPLGQQKHTGIKATSISSYDNLLSREGYLMILFGKKHLHVSESNLIVDSLLKFLKVTSGSVKLEVANQPVLKIEIGRSNHVESDAINRTIVKLDLLEPTFLGVPDDQTSLYDKLRTATEFAEKLTDSFFRISDDQTSLYDKLRTATEFAEKLTDNGITLSLLRRGKEAITLGEGARPSLSRIITRSGDIQVDSIKESVKLENEFDDT